MPKDISMKSHNFCPLSIQLKLGKNVDADFIGAIFILLRRKS